MALMMNERLSEAPPLDPKTRSELSLMMFLQFAVWGSWFTVLGNRLTAMNLGEHIGSIFATMPLGTIFAPIFIGQIADRYFSSERLMGILHLLGAGVLWYLAMIPPAIAGDADSIASTASLFWWVALIYAFLYSPTLSLSSSISFTHVPDGGRDFPSIRVLGTIGWIAAGLAVDYILPWFGENPQQSELPLKMAAVVSVVIGLYSFFLPHTPPLGKAGDALPFMRAISLLKEPAFAVFFGTSFVITIVLAFYYNFTGTYLEKAHGYAHVASTMTLGQGSELFLLLLLPWFLQSFGMKWILSLGMLAWGLRYLMFALAPQLEGIPRDFLVLTGLILHGVCFDFFFAAGFIYVDREAPKDIRGSAQALFVFLTYGVAMYLGGELSGLVKNWVTVDKVTDWQTFWLVPCSGVMAALVIFVIFFKPQHKI